MVPYDFLEDPYATRFSIASCLFFTSSRIFQWNQIEKVEGAYTHLIGDWLGSEKHVPIENVIFSQHVLMISQQVVSSTCFINLRVEVSPVLN